jgi:lipopolysaccharide/colanic/teichoic acid biosynthesis glycosyltransferase
MLRNFGDEGMRISKRLFDLVCAILGLIILAPFFLIVAVLIKITDKGPIFFRQERVGYKGQLFKIWKFRTMIIDAEKQGGQLTIGDDKRITPIGRFLRKTKLDELPQLINVVLGEMSFVGPRPEVPKYVNLYNEAQKRVLELMPGITDPASMKYRNENELLATSDNPENTYIKEIMPEKISINLEYGLNANLITDFSVIIKTILGM